MNSPPVFAPPAVLLRQHGKRNTPLDRLAVGRLRQIEPAERVGLLIGLTDDGPEYVLSEVPGRFLKYLLVGSEREVDGHVVSSLGSDTADGCTGAGGRGAVHSRHLAEPVHSGSQSSLMVVPGRGWGTADLQRRRASWQAAARPRVVRDPNRTADRTLGATSHNEVTRKPGADESLWVRAQ